MSRVPPSRFTRLGIAVALSLVGCGGAAKTEPNPTAGAMNGGSTGSGGAPLSVGGKGGGMSGATGSGGTALGIAGNSGAAATGDICDLPWEGGDCAAAFPKYWHNPVSGQCELRMYGGCGGNENQFDTYEVCKFVCNAVEPSDTSCTKPLDCELRSPNCCASCEPVAASDVIAVNRAAPSMTCNELCGACPPIAPNESTRRYLIPGCVAHRCTVVDIRQTAITECVSSSDCRLRNSAACCEPCNPIGDPIAYNANVALAPALCGGEAACPPCVPHPADGFVAECVGARCVVEQFVE